MVGVPQQVRVCIIGAGAAGLSAAQRLVKAGIRDVVVLEAQERVGGRVNTVPHGDHVLEMGAHWIHGEEGNVVYQWAAEHDHVDDEPVLTQTGIGETTFVRENGEILPASVMDPFEIAYCNLEEQAEKDLPTYPHSVGEYYTEKFKAVNKWGVVGEELLNWKGRFQNCIDGTDSWFECSAQGHSCYKECPGNVVGNWKNGYGTLFNHFQEEVPDTCIHLNTPVECIEWSPPDTTSTGCRVSLYSGHVVEAQHVIFTPSLAVLKAVDMFKPPLPEKKNRAIEGLGIGAVDKIFIKFPYQWWDTGCEGFSFLLDLENVPKLITKENWELGLLGFYEVHKQPNMLCGWITGAAARMMEQVSEEKVTQKCVSELRRRLQSRFEIPNPIWGTRSTWFTNPWTRGSYSFRSTTSDIMNVWAADLAEPLLDPEDIPRICFAGEATHDCFYSTVHGAVETGWREADRLIQHISRSDRGEVIKEIPKSPVHVPKDLIQGEITGTKAMSASKL